MVSCSVESEGFVFLLLASFLLDTMPTSIHIPSSTTTVAMMPNTNWGMYIVLLITPFLVSFVNNL